MSPDERGRPRFAGPLSLLLLAVALAFHFAPFPWPANRFDAGIDVVAAQRVLRGDAPYVDFQTLYTPGRYYLVAAAFAAFGARYDVASHLDFALMALQAWLAWHVAARLSGSRFVALLAFAAGLAFSYPFPSILLGLFALLVAERSVRRDSLPHAVAAGGLAGLAAWFRQDFGFASSVAVAAALWAGTTGGVRARLVRAASAGLAAAAILALLLLPAIVLAPAHLLEGLVTNPAATVPFRSSPDGVAAVFREEWFFGAVAALALVGGAIGLARAFTRPDPSKALLVGMATLTLWALRYLCLRPETHHLVPAGLLVGVLGAAALPRGSAWRLVVFSVCAAAVFVPFRRAAAARLAQLAGRRAETVATLGGTLPGASTLYLPVGEVDDYRRLVERVRALVPPGEPFLSACDRHDRVYDQDLLLYFVVGRPAVAFDWHFDPGVTTRADVQRRIVVDCEGAGIGVVVRYASRAPDVKAPAPDGARVLDEWLAANFEPAESIGRYEIWTAR